MQFDLSQRWTETDKPILFMHNFTDVRESIDFFTGNELIENNTLNGSLSSYANSTK